MKLAEALILRADLKTRAAQLRERLKQNAQVQEGEKPFQDPQEILREFEQVAAQLEQLIKNINKTNSQLTFDEGKTMTDALAERDVLKMRVSVYRQVVADAIERPVRYGLSEIKMLAAIDVSKTQKAGDEIARQLRELDTRIQELNWASDLIE
jgi:hypothetical protein